MVYRVLILLPFLLFKLTSSTATVGEPDIVNKIYFDQKKNVLHIFEHKGYDDKYSTFSLQNMSSSIPRGNYEKNYNYIDSQFDELDQLSIEKMEFTISFKLIKFHDLLTPDGYLNFDGSHYPIAQKQMSISIKKNGKRILYTFFSSCGGSDIFEIRAYSSKKSNFIVFVLSPIGVCMEGGYKKESYHVIKNVDVEDSMFMKTPSHEGIKYSIFKNSDLASFFYKEAIRNRTLKQYHTAYHIFSTINKYKEDKKWIEEKIKTAFLNNNENYLYSSVRDYLLLPNKKERLLWLQNQNKFNVLKSKIWHPYVYRNPKHMPPNINQLNSLSSLAYYGAIDLIKDQFQKTYPCRDYTPSEKNKALVLAVQNKQIEVAHFLIEKGAIGSCSNYHQPRVALIEAVKNNNIELIKKITPISDVNCFDQYGKSALMVSLDSGYTNIVDFLLKEGADPYIVKKNTYQKNSVLSKIIFDQRDFTTATLLINNSTHSQYKEKNTTSILVEAVHRNDTVILKFMFDHGANPNVIYKKEPLLNYAIKYNKGNRYLRSKLRNMLVTDATFLLADWADVNKKSISGKTALDEAINQEKDIELIDLLASKSTDLNKLGACFRKRRLDYAKVLLKYGADIDPVHNNFVYNAVKYNDKEVLDFLYTHHADFEQLTNYDMTPISTLIMHGDHSAIALLMSYNINLSATDKNENSVLMNVIKYMDSTVLMSSILKSIDDVNYANSKGETAIHYAAKATNGVEKLNLLLSNGADIRRTDKNGNNALVHSMKGDTSTISYLLENGFSLNFRNKEKQNLLTYSVKYNNLKATYYLINRGLNVNNKSKTKWTALHEAVIQQNYNLVNLLLNSGAKQVKSKYYGYPIDISISKGFDDITKLLKQ